MRYIRLKVSEEDRDNIKKRKDGSSETQGLFGQAELLQRLMEVSPKCTKMEDVTQLLRLSRKLEKIENEKDPILELPEDEWQWLKKTMDHDKYSSYGPPLMRRIGELLEAITEAKTEKED